MFEWFLHMDGNVDPFILISLFFLLADKRGDERTYNIIIHKYIRNVCVIGAMKSGRLVGYHRNDEPFVTYSTIHLETRRFYSTWTQKRLLSFEQTHCICSFIHCLNSFLILNIFVFSFRRLDFSIEFVLINMCVLSAYSVLFRLIHSVHCIHVCNEGS